MFGYTIAFFIAAGIGLISSIIGMGGGFLYVPTLTLIFGLDQKMAVGTSLAVMVFSSFAATLVYQRQQKILYAVAALLIVPGSIFSVLGSVLTSYIDAWILVVLFSFVLILMSLQMLIPSFRLVPPLLYGPSLQVHTSGPDEKNNSISIMYLHLVIWGAMGGLISGTTGISSGVLFVPALVAIGIPVHFAVATSLLTIIPTSLSGAATHAVLGHISLPFLAVYGAGAGIGAYAGASIAPRIHADHIRKFFGILLVVIALLMIQQKVIGG